VLTYSTLLTDINSSLPPPGGIAVPRVCLLVGWLVGWFADIQPPAAVAGVGRGRRGGRAVLHAPGEGNTLRTLFLVLVKQRRMQQ